MQTSCVGVDVGLNVSLGPGADGSGVGMGVTSSADEALLLFDPPLLSSEDADLGLLFVDFVPVDSLLRVIDDDDEVVDGMLSKCSLRKI